MAVMVRALLVLWHQSLAALGVTTAVDVACLLMAIYSAEGHGLWVALFYLTSTSIAWLARLGL